MSELTNLELAAQQGNQAGPNLIDAQIAGEIDTGVFTEERQEQGNRVPELIVLYNKEAVSENLQKAQEQYSQAVPLLIDAANNGEFDGGSYTPASYLKMTGQAVTSDDPEITSSRLIFTADTELYLETSTDQQTWTPLTGVLDDWWFSDMIELDEGDVLYVRASQPSDSLNAEIACDGAIYMEGNAYAIFSPNLEDWITLRYISFNRFITDTYSGITHLPDLPAYVFPERDDYLPLPYLGETNCLVSDNGIIPNFHIGVSQQYLVDIGFLPEVWKSYAGMFTTIFGNGSGFNENYISFAVVEPANASSSSLSYSPLNLSTLIQNNLIAFESDVLIYYGLSYLQLPTAGLLTDGNTFVVEVAEDFGVEGFNTFNDTHELLSLPYQETTAVLIPNGIRYEVNCENALKNNIANIFLVSSTSSDSPGF